VFAYKLADAALLTAAFAEVVWTDPSLKTILLPTFRELVLYSVFASAVAVKVPVVSVVTSSTTNIVFDELVSKLGNTGSCDILIVDIF
jgi:hypothetical protein